jgi:hypothetical protein
VENSYVRDSYIPVLQSLSVFNEDDTDEEKHVMVFKTAYLEVVVSHGYFDVLTNATAHSVIDRVLESDVSIIFVEDTQRLENGNVRIPDETTTPTPADCIACTTSNGDIEEWSCRT